jgi:hypothetical protein
LGGGQVFVYPYGWEFLQWFSIIFLIFCLFYFVIIILIKTRDLNNILKILKGNPQHVRQVFFIIIAGSEDNSLQYLEQVVVEYAREKGILVVEDLSAFEDSLGKEFWRDHMDSCKEASFDEILDGFDNFVKQVRLTEEKHAG